MFLVQRILLGIEKQYENETDLRKKIILVEKCADTFSYLKRHQQSKNYYLKQVNKIQIDNSY